MMILTCVILLVKNFRQHMNFMKEIKSHKLNTNSYMKYNVYVDTLYSTHK